jgi:hypothetical protein
MKRFDTKVGYLNGDTVKSVTDCGAYVPLNDVEGNFTFAPDDAVSVVTTADLDKVVAERNELRDRVQGLYAEQTAFKHENLELRKRLTVWCDAIENDKLCTKAARHRMSRGDREVWPCDGHRDQASAWAGDGGPGDRHVAAFVQMPGTLDEWPGPEERKLP